MLKSLSAGWGWESPSPTPLLCGGGRNREPPEVYMEFAAHWVPLIVTQDLFGQVFHACLCLVWFHSFIQQTTFEHLWYAKHLIKPGIERWRGHSVWLRQCSPAPCVTWEIDMQILRLYLRPTEWKSAFLTRSPGDSETYWSLRSTDLVDYGRNRRSSSIS